MARPLGIFPFGMYRRHSLLPVRVLARTQLEDHGRLLQRCATVDFSREIAARLRRTLQVCDDVQERGPVEFRPLFLGGVLARQHPAQPFDESADIVTALFHLTKLSTGSGSRVSQPCKIDLLGRGSAYNRR